MKMKNVPVKYSEKLLIEAAQNREAYCYYFEINDS